MAKQKNIITEFRNYPLRVEFPILLLTGNQWWISDVPSANLHFHNCLEIGLCHEGEGTLIIQKESRHFSAGDITIIARNIPHTTYSAPGTQRDGESISGTGFWFLRGDLYHRGGGCRD